MAAEAEGLGANALVGVRFDAAEVGREFDAQHSGASLLRKGAILRPIQLRFPTG